jgi:phosphate-selective porin OprO/OprP
MNKYLLMPILATCFLASSAQDFDTDPSITIDNQKENLHFTVGARMMADVAYYHSDFTPLKSGASLTDARIRTSMAFKDWYFYADFGFGGGKFSQKNIFLQYNWLTPDKSGHHAIKAGYYNDAMSMARNTSLGSYHFISRPGSASALSDGRALGVTYKFYNKNFFANQGVFSENAYNKQEAGYNGIAVSGRWLYRPVNDANETFHIGAKARFGHLGGGEVYNNTLKKTLTLGQPLETYVDEDESFISAELPWANNVISVGAEALYMNKDFFIRGEYNWKHVTKKRDTYSLFIDAQDNIDGWGSLEAWSAANPLRNNNFHGAYVEAGYKIFGPAYKYNNADALLGGLDGKALEVVVRFNYTGLNDVVKGEYYSAGRDQYYPSGYVEDWPYASSSVGGGNIYSGTIGANYSFNKYVAVMLDYTYSRIDRDKLPYDKNVHAVQGRVVFSF